MSLPGPRRRSLGRNLVAELAQHGRPLLGTWVKIPALETVEMLGYAGFDFVVVDLEHSPIALESAYRAIVVAQASGMAALARVPDHTGADAQRLLDAGADGIFVPRVRSADEARRAVAAMVFAPAGARGMGRTSRAGSWALSPADEYFDRGNDAVLRCLQLEELSALETVEEILEVEHLGAIFVGLADLTMSSGLAANEPKLQRLVARVVSAAKARSVPVGTAVADAAAARRAIDAGYDFVAVSNDASLFGKAAVSLVDTIRTGG